ncbi:MAG TPA: CYTH domain-containing protein [Candidatus Hydrogenedentes bacterium]|nr:CYTH domain-containing protein [Candidatus Hydrogenedentota bacterium]
MGKEIERKFLVKDDRWRSGACGMECSQGYLAAGPPVSVRVRIMDDRAVLTIKKGVASIVRDEYEYSIPLGDAQCMLAELCEGCPIEKTRYIVMHEGHKWEIDVFHGHNEGLIVAEVELQEEEEPFVKPPWLGEEVSGDPRYLNSHLTKHPFRLWRNG